MSKCKKCGKETRRLFKGLCIRCMQERAKRHYREELEEQDNMFNSEFKQSGKTTYDDVRKICDIESVPKVIIKN